MNQPHSLRRICTRCRDELGRAVTKSRKHVEQGFVEGLHADPKDCVLALANQQDMVMQSAQQALAFAARLQEQIRIICEQNNLPLPGAAGQTWSVCSAHQVPEPGCERCNVSIPATKAEEPQGG